MNTKTVKIEIEVGKYNDDGFIICDKLTGINIFIIKPNENGIFMIESIYSKRVPYKLFQFNKEKISEISTEDIKCIMSDVRIEKVEDIFILRLIDTTYEGDFAFYCGESIIIGNLFEIYNKEE